MLKVDLIQFQNKLNDQNVMEQLNVIKIQHSIIFNQIHNLYQLLLFNLHHYLDLGSLLYYNIQYRNSILLWLNYSVYLVRLKYLRNYIQYYINLIIILLL